MLGLVDHMFQGANAAMVREATELALEKMSEADMCFNVSSSGW